MSNRKACEQWMSSVEKSGSFQAWLERQNKHRENESSAGNNKAACNRWIKGMGEMLPTVYDTTLVIVCHRCKNFFSMVNFCRRCEALSCVSCTRIDDRCEWCGEIQGYGQNRGARLLHLWWTDRVDYVGWSSGLCKLLYVVVAKD